MSIRKSLPWLAYLLAQLWPSIALAHVEAGSASGLLAGLHHPVSGLDHALAMIAVGLWGAQLGMPAAWALPVAFPMVMALGGMIGLMGAPIPGVEVAVAASAVTLGALVFREMRPPLWLAAVVVAFFAVFHGHAHGRELPEGESALLYSLGFVVATGTLHALGITVGLLHCWRTGRLAIRFTGACVGLAGLSFLWSALA